MKKQKQISTPIGLVIIAVAIVILFGGVFLWKYFALKQIKAPFTNSKMSVANQKQQILNKQFPLAGEAQNSSDQTAEWKTLSNNYGWSIKYPSNWEAYGIEGEQAEKTQGPFIDGPVGCIKNLGKDCASGILGVDVENFSQVSGMTPKQFLLDYQLKYDPRPLISQTELQIDKEPAYEVAYQSNVSGDAFGIEIAVSHNGILYDISYNQWGADFKSIDDWTLTPIFNQMLSTFKFTN